MGDQQFSHVQPMNHQIMKRCAMLKNHAVHGKTVGLVLGSRYFSSFFSAIERKDMNPKPDPERGVRAEKKALYFNMTHAWHFHCFACFGIVNVKSKFLAVSCLM